MSALIPIGRPAHRVTPELPNRATLELLGPMKLRAPSDAIVHQNMVDWVESRLPSLSQLDKYNAPKCKIPATMLLHRLARAFEKRNVSKQKSRKPLPPYSKLLQSTVKVTESVKKAIQFVGSDLLKVLQLMSPSPTVAEVADFCLSVLSQNDYYSKELFRIFEEATGKSPSTFDEAASQYFGVFAIQALQALRGQAVSTYEFAHDFEMIYRTCYQVDCFRNCMAALRTESSARIGMDTEARNICWKLARLLALQEECKDWFSSKNSRANRILVIAASVVIVANIGKAVKDEVSGDVTSGKNESIPQKEDFVDILSAPVHSLLEFLTKNTSHDHNEDYSSCISNIKDRVEKTCTLITNLEIGKGTDTDNLTSPQSRSLLSEMLPPGALKMLLYKYRTVITALMVHTQKKLGVETSVKQGATQEPSVRTVLANVLFFFPMVIGEPWGIHRDAPMIATKMLCLHVNVKPPDPLKKSAAIVMEMNSKVRLKKRKIQPKNSKVPNSIPMATKKTKRISFTKAPPKEKPKGLQESPNIDGESIGSPIWRTQMKPIGGENEIPLINDLSELNEWTLSMLSVSIIKPSDTLLTYLGENDRTRGDGSSCLQDVIVPVVNRGALRIQNAIHSSINLNSDAVQTTLSVGKKDGQVYVNGQVDNNVQLCASIVGLYYYSLEAMIKAQMERMDFLGSFASQLQSRSFHRALLACCYSCVLKGVGMNQKLKISGTKDDVSVLSLIKCTETDPYTFLKVIEAFCRALIATKEVNKGQSETPIVAGLPIILHKHVQKIEQQLIDSVLWNTPVNAEVSGQKDFPLAIQTMQNLPGAWPPDILEPMLPEEIVDLESEVSKSDGVRFKPSFGSSSESNFLSFVLRKLLKVAFFRIRAICATLNLSNEAALHTQILVAFRYLLRCQISIFNGRHVDQLLLCTIYGVCRVMNIQPKISFGKVIDAYLTIREEDQGERACRIIVRHVKLELREDGSQSEHQVVGNIITFYNSVYVPKMQKYFLGSKALKQASESYKKSCKNDGSKNSQISNNITVDTLPNEQPVTIDPSLAVETSQLGTSVQTKSRSVGLGTKNVNQNGDPGKPETVRNGLETMEIKTVDLRNEKTRQTSKKVTESHENGTVAGRSSEEPKTDSISTLSVKENLISNGQLTYGSKKADSNSEKKNGSKVSVVVGQKSSTAGATATGPKDSTIAISQDPSNPSSSTLANGTNGSSLSTENNENGRTLDEVEGGKMTEGDGSD